MDGYENEKSGFFGQIFKGVGISVIFTLLCVLVFALLIKMFSIGDGVIRPVNQIIKILAIFLGCFFSVSGEKGYLKGFFIGLLTVVLTFLIFAFISGGFSFDKTFLYDLIFGGIVGLISGIIDVNLKR